MRPFLYLLPLLAACADVIATTGEVDGEAIEFVQGVFVATNRIASADGDGETAPALLVLLSTDPDHDLCDRVAERTRDAPSRLGLADHVDDRWDLLMVAQDGEAWGDLRHAQGWDRQSWLVWDGRLRERELDPKQSYAARADVMLVDVDWKPAGALSVRFSALHCAALERWYLGAR